MDDKEMKEFLQSIMSEDNQTINTAFNKEQLEEMSKGQDTKQTIVLAKAGSIGKEEGFGVIEETKPIYVTNTLTPDQKKESQDYIETFVSQGDATIDTRGIQQDASDTKDSAKEKFLQYFAKQNQANNQRAKSGGMKI